MEDRRANEVAVIDHYLEALAKFGGPSLSTNDDDVMKEYAKATMAGMGWILTPYALQKKKNACFRCANDMVLRSLVISQSKLSRLYGTLSDYVTVCCHREEFPVESDWR